MLYTNKLVAGEDTGVVPLEMSTKLTRGINTPDELDEISKLDDALGFVVPIPTWEKEFIENNKAESSSSCFIMIILIN